MNNQELEARNKTLERRWKIMLALAIVFLASRPVALYIVNNIIHKAGIENFTDEFPLLDPARKFIPQENYVTNIQPLREYLAGLDDTPDTDEGDTFSIYYEQLNSGSNISVNKDVRLFPASLSKLALALIVAKKVEDGELSWNKTLTHTSADLSTDSGELYKTIGNGPTSVEKLVEELLVNSDNTAQNILLKNVQVPGDYLALQAATGLEDLYDERGYVSAKEYTRFFRILYTSSFLAAENSEKILEYLSNSTFHDYLSQGIPDDIKFAHKYGENKELSIFADSGIVYDNGKPYMLTVIIKGKDSSEESRNSAMQMMKEISQRAYAVGK